MRHYLQNLNKAFDNRIRLGIMSALVSNESMDFKSLKVLLDITDGNLASHLKGLEKEAYIKVEKQFIGRKPNTTYTVTKSGLSAFQEHINALEFIISEQLNTRGNE